MYAKRGAFYNVTRCWMWWQYHSLHITTFCNYDYDEGDEDDDDYDNNNNKNNDNDR